MAARKNPQALTQRQAKMVAIVRAAAAGISSAEMGRRFGIGQRAAKRSLSTLAARGLVANVRARHLSVWCTPERQQALHAAIPLKPRPPRKSRAKPRPEKPKAAPVRRVAPEDRDDPLLFKKPTIVPAAIAPRIETRGVPSVFHLGYAA